MNDFTALILAGGRGTRLQGLFPDIPKPLVPVSEQPFLYWLVRFLQQQGLAHFVFSTGYKGELIEIWLSHNAFLPSESWRSFRESDPLGTGGGVRACLDLCRDNVLVTNGDSLIVTDLQPMLWRFAAERELDAMIVAKPLADASRYGSLAVVDGFLTGFREKKPGAGLINAGIYLFRRRVLEPFPKNKNLSMEYDIMPKLIEGGAKIAVFEVAADAPFIDIGTPETVASAAQFVRNNF